MVDRVHVFSILWWFARITHENYHSEVALTKHVSSLVRSFVCLLVCFNLGSERNTMYYTEQMQQNVTQSELLNETDDQSKESGHARFLRGLLFVTPP